MTLTKTWPVSAGIAWIAMAAVGAAWAQENSVPALPAKDVSFQRPELPRVSVDTRMPEQQGKTIEVPADGDLQRAIDDARLGDTIVLQAGAAYEGTFVLPDKAGDGWIVVKSSAESRLPEPGTRVTPAFAEYMPKLVTNQNGQPCLRTQPGAHHYRFVGIQFGVAPAVTRIYTAVEISHQSTKLEDVPSHFVFDRVYIHGNSELNSQRGLAINSRHTAVIDSWIDEWHIHGFDSQAICCWNGPGPFKIENCFLEGGAENIMFGGARNSAECMVPSDIEIRRCHFYKNPEWSKLKYPENWVVKNLFEIKVARRVLLEGNVLENCWAEGQTGFAFVLKSASPSQGQPWDTTSDITIRHNRIVNCRNGFSIARWSSSGPVVPGAAPTSRILIEHNLFERFGDDGDFGGQGGGSIMFQVSGVDLTMRHNTAWNGYNMISQTKTGSDNLVFIDNLVTPGSYGVHCDGLGDWNRGLGTQIQGNSRFEGNTVIRDGSDRARSTNPNGYPPNNLWFDSFDQAGVDRATQRILPQSSIKGTATDGKDPGADIDAVMQATAGVRATEP